MTDKRYNEKKEYLENCLQELKVNLEKYHAYEGDDIKKSMEMENLFSSLVKTKKKLGDMINDIQMELEVITF